MYVKRISVVVTNQTFYIFQQEGLWLVDRQYPGDIMEERSASIFETFSISSYAERLAWKACKQQIMCRNVPRLNFSYIAPRTFAEVCYVGQLRVSVPFGTKDAFSKRLES